MHKILYINELGRNEIVNVEVSSHCSASNIVWDESVDGPILGNLDQESVWSLIRVDNTLQPSEERLMEAREIERLRLEAQNA